MAKERIYGLDVLRILSMVGVIGLHVTNNAGIFGVPGIHPVNYYAALFLRIAFSCSVNVFAMLTGYLYINRTEIKSASVFRLIAVVIFYCSVVTAITTVFFPSAFKGTKGFLKSLIPPLNSIYWYITSYIFVFFMIPYLNAFLTGISRRKYFTLTVTLLIFLSLFSSLGLGRVDFLSIEAGYSPFWLIVCYIIGGYLRLYSTDTVRLKSSLLTVLFFGGIFAVMLLTILLRGIWQGFGGLLYEYNSPFTVLNSVLLVLIFSRLKLTNAPHRLILSLSSAAFGAYIIHGQYVIYYEIIKKAFLFIGQNPPRLRSHVCSLFRSEYTCCAGLPNYYAGLYSAFR